MESEHKSPDLHAKPKYSVGQRVKHDLHGIIVLRSPILESGNWHANPVGSRRKLIVGEHHIVGLADKH